MPLNDKDLFVNSRNLLTKSKMLHGLLPICASCKKIRDNNGFWQEIEEYIRDHSEADFTHGCCPTCAEKYYPEYTNAAVSV